MPTDLEILKELEKEIGKKLEKIKLKGISDEANNGYALNEDKHIVGLNLDKNNLGYFPISITKFNSLLKLSLFENNITKLPKERFCP